jgi:hypothetical protein
MEVEDEEIELKLTKDEALVLFEFVSRFSDEDKLEIVDQAEQRVLWNVCCLLEKQLVEPFSADYLAIIEQARNKVRDLVEEA